MMELRKQNCARIDEIRRFKHKLATTTLTHEQRETETKALHSRLNVDHAHMSATYTSTHLQNFVKQGACGGFKANLFVDENGLCVIPE
jgi:hypothetical protein